MVCVAARASSSAGVRWVGSPRWFCVSDAIPPSVQTGATTGHPGDGFAREAQRLSHHQQWTATAGSDVVPSGRPIFDDFFQHLWPYIGNNTAKVVFQMVKRLWLIRIDQ
ncbi:uncharacterized protein TNCV_3831521 [Trichonephila clavipes]|nr:uncharacterized protein TNCV_3831521 [Trichonephila clavipes]